MCVEPYAEPCKRVPQGSAEFNPTPTLKMVLQAKACRTLWNPNAGFCIGFRWYNALK